MTISSTERFLLGCLISIVGFLNVLMAAWLAFLVFGGVIVSSHDPFFVKYALYFLAGMLSVAFLSVQLERAIHAALFAVLLMGGVAIGLLAMFLDSIDYSSVSYYYFIACLSLIGIWSTYAGRRSLRSKFWLYALCTPSMILIVWLMQLNKAFVGLLG